MAEFKMEQLCVLVDFLGQVLGPDYEVVLQDLSKQKNCIAHIAHGEISGRKIGSPVTNAALNLIKEKKYLNCDFITNYKGQTHDGIVLRSSTFFFKKSNGEPYALLCINFSDARYIELHDKLLSLAHPLCFLQNYSSHTIQDTNISGTLENDGTIPSNAHLNMTENFMPDINVLMNNMYDNASVLLNLPSERLTQTEKIEVVTELDKQGMFQLKGAVSFVAQKLDCSVASIYRYISEINK